MDLHSHYSQTTAHDSRCGRARPLSTHSPRQRENFTEDKTKPNQQQNLTDRTPNAVCHRHVSPASKLHLEIVLLSMIIRGLYPASSSRPNQPQFITNPDKWELYSDRKSRQSGADLCRRSCRAALTDYDRSITTELRAPL